MVAAQCRTDTALTSCCSGGGPQQPWSSGLAPVSRFHSSVPLSHSSPYLIGLLASVDVKQQTNTHTHTHTHTRTHARTHIHTHFSFAGLPPLSKIQKYYIKWFPFKHAAGQSMTLQACSPLSLLTVQSFKGSIIQTCRRLEYSFAGSVYSQKF